MRLSRFVATPLLAAAVLAAAGPGRADDKAKPAAGPDRRPVDTAVYRTLRDVINRGADLYNSGDVNGCYRLYQGALMAVAPLLEQRPELQRAIGEGIANAERTPQLDRRAFVLREVLDRVRADLNPNPPAPRGTTAPEPDRGKGPARPDKATDKVPDRRGDVPPPTVPSLPAPAPEAKSLWDRLGGEKGVGKVVDDVLDTAGKDPKVDFWRSGKFTPTKESVARLRELIIEQVSSATGGPFKYTGRDMKAAHKGMGITDAQFDAFVTDFRAALQKNGAKPDDVAAVVRFLEGTRKDVVEAKPTEPPAPAPAPGAPPPPPPPPGGAATTLWERLGGEKGVARVVDDLVDTAGKDPKVNFWREPGFKPTPMEVQKLKTRIVHQISAASGGPYKYEGKDMRDAHKNLGITDAQFDAFMADLKATLDRNGVKPEDAQPLVDALKRYRGDIVEKKSEGTKAEEKK
jgi:hemoglobin